MQYSFVYLACFRVVVSLVREIPMAMRVLNLRELHVYTNYANSLNYMSIVFQEDLASSCVNGSFAIQQSRHELRLQELSKQ